MNTIPIYFLKNMKTTQLSDQQLINYALGALLQDSVSLLEYLKKSGASGEASIWNPERSPENLIDTEQSQTGQKRGNI